jgi:MFS-type transporter involved in bile tolerance (Atg22 family)
VLLVVLKFNGENEAEELMEFIDSSSCSEPTTSSPTTLIAVLAVILGKFIDVERSAVPEGSWRARKSRDNRY